MQVNKVNKSDVGEDFFFLSENNNYDNDKVNESLRESGNENNNDDNLNETATEQDGKNGNDALIDDREEGNEENDWR